MKGLDTLSTDELVARYAEAARVHGEATVTGSHPANNEADLIAAAYRELRRRGSESALLVLLESKDEGVTAWAGAHALEFAPEQGEPVLAKLAESPGLLGFGAQIHASRVARRSPYVPLAGESLVWASVLSPDVERSSGAVPLEETPMPSVVGRFSRRSVVRLRLVGGPSPLERRKPE